MQSYVNTKMAVKPLAFLIAFASLGATTSVLANTYSLEVINNSSNAASIAVFQTDPNVGVRDVQSLAWFAEYAYPGTGVEFKWGIDYGFVWDKTGELIPGVVFDANQFVPADLEDSNEITLSYDSENHAYHFASQRRSDSDMSGSLVITEDETIPLKEASVGVAMSGRGTFVVQAQPNMNLTFSPHPTYWVTFGNYVEGQVMDVTQSTNKAKVEFPPNVLSMKAILNQDNTWTIKPAK